MGHKSPLSQFAGFLNKGATPCPNHSGSRFTRLSCSEQHKLGCSNEITGAQFHLQPGRASLGLSMVNHSKVPEDWTWRRWVPRVKASPSQFEAAVSSVHVSPTLPSEDGYCSTQHLLRPLHVPEAAGGSILGCMCFPEITSHEMLFLEQNGDPSAPSNSPQDVHVLTPGSMNVTSHAKGLRR